MITKILTIAAITGTNIAALPTAVYLANETIALNNEFNIIESKEDKITSSLNEFRNYISEEVVFNSPRSYGITDEMDEELLKMARDNEVWSWIGTPIFEQIEVQLEGMSFSSLEQSNYLYSVKELFEGYYPGLRIDLDAVSFYDASRTYADAYNYAVQTGSNDRMASYPTNFRVNENESCNSSTGLVFNENDVYKPQFGADDALPGSGWKKDDQSVSGLIRLSDYANDSTLDNCHMGIMDSLWSDSNSDWNIGSNFTIYNGYNGFADRILENDYSGNYATLDSKKKVAVKELRYLHRGYDDLEYRNETKVIMLLDYFGYENTLEANIYDLGYHSIEHILVYDNINNLVSDFMAMNAFTGERLDTNSGSIVGNDYVNMANVETLNMNDLSVDMFPTIITPTGSEWYYRNLLDNAYSNFSTIDGKQANTINYQTNSPLQFDGASYSTIIHSSDDFGLPAMTLERHSNSRVGDNNTRSGILNDIFDTILSSDVVNVGFQNLQHNMSVIAETNSLIRSSDEEIDLLRYLHEQGLLVMVIYENDMFYQRTSFYNEQIDAMNDVLNEVIPGNTESHNPVKISLEILDSPTFQDYNLGLKRDFGIGGLMSFSSDIANRKVSISSYEQETVVYHRLNIDKYPGIQSVNDQSVAVSYTSGLLNKVIEEKGIMSEFTRFNSISDPSLESLKNWATSYDIHIYDSTEEVLQAMNSNSHSLALINNSSIYGGVLLHQYPNILKLGSFESTEYFFPLSLGMTEDREDIRDITFSPRPYDICQVPNDPNFTQDDDYLLGTGYEVPINITCDDLRSANPWFENTDGRNLAFTEADSEVIYGIFTKLLSASDTSARHRHHVTFTDYYEELISSKLLTQYRFVGISIIMGLVLLLTYKPISRSIISSEKNVQLANIDQLTGLYNRRYLNERAEYWENNPDSSLTVCYIDFDKFKKVNDFYGHDAGDELLKIFSSKIKSYVGANSEAYRVGGDEFIMIIQDTKRRQVEKIMTSLRKDISRQIIFASYSIIPSVSIGISHTKVALNPKLADSITAADFALYEAKDNTELAWYSEESHFVLSYVNNIIKNGISQDILKPNFQPIVTKDKKVIGFETLFRSEDDSINQNIGKIISQLEKSNSTDIVDIAMTEKVANIMTTQWKEEILNSDIWISVNISPKTLAKQMFFLEEAAETLKDGGIPAERLTIEILEFDSEDTQLIDQLKYIKSLGFNIAIDDFTAGSSSLSRIINLKGLIHHIKIDQQVIQNSDAEIVRNTINFTRVLADSINCHSVIVEGVETKDKVVGDDSTYYQGYYFSRPLPPEKAIKVLTDGELKDEE